MQGTQDTSIAAILYRAEQSLRAAGLDTPRLDAEVLLAHALGIDRATLLARLKEPLPSTTQSTFAALLERRLQHEPVAYLVQHREFFGLDFYVDRRVLIPRPETELLVERVLQLYAASAPHSHPWTIADVGTGSGCIAIALAVHLPEALIYGLDISEDALAVAQINVERHGVGERVRLVRSDLLADLSPDLQFDIIVANLPYVATTEWAALPRTVGAYEPVATALMAGPEGLDLIARLLPQAAQRLKPGGVLLLEIGAQQGATVATLAREAFPQATIEVLPDLAGLDRVVEIHTPPAREA